MVERAVDRASLDSFGLQFSPEHLTRKVAALLAGGDPVNCERGIVYQTHLFESIEYRINRSLGHLLSLERLVKLVSGARSGSQLAQRDRTGHRLSIGVYVLRLWG